MMYVIYKIHFRCLPLRFNRQKQYCNYLNYSLVRMVQLRCNFMLARKQFTRTLEQFTRTLEQFTRTLEQFTWTRIELLIASI